MSLDELKQDLNALGNSKRAEASKWFFKTGKGEYGEGDVFLGVSVGDQRKIAKKYKDLSFDVLQHLLDSQYHEHRLTALFIMVGKYQKSKSEDVKREVVDFYLKNTKNINNWDLVDSSAHKILGDYLLDKDKSILYHLAKSKSLWDRRIAIISTMWFINNNHFTDALKIAKILLKDKHDLIHKAVGWMLREIGKKDQGLEETFLKKHYKSMPRTMLRYAIEKFEEEKRKKYLKSLI